tara:strand:- start:283 stop:1836 length:1554 start_codon:yes stop_codon:yes gene_type:complete
MESSSATEKLMREVCGQGSGTVCVSADQIARAVHTRRHEKDIGRDSRADRIRGWLANEVNAGRVLLQDWEWMGPGEREMASLRLKILDMTEGIPRQQERTRLESLEAKGAVLTWAAENEEPKGEGEPVTLRKEKRAQLRTARHRMWAKLGQGSLDAALLLLVLEEAAYPEADPAANWISAAATWTTQRGWTTRSVAELTQEAEEKLQEMRANSKPRDGDRTADLILDLGEGWGSIGIAAAEMDCATIGVDNAGLIYQGSLHGHIRARVQIDFADSTGKNLLRRIGAKAEIGLTTVMLVWLSPECTLLSRANSMNTSRGCAHGPYAETPENIAAATPQRLKEEREKYGKCKRAIENQMRALEQENMPFALENPTGSHFWELERVVQTIRRMRSKGWVVHQVDQCAFGRMAKKPTSILTNTGWTPEGITGTGRCIVGRCTGTMGQLQGQPGAGRHSQQTVANESDRRSKMGNAPKGARGEYSVAAAKNRVETGLVQEIIGAARDQWNKRKHRKRERTED